MKLFLYITFLIFIIGALVLAIMYRMNDHQDDDL